jgi:hypothetical protein
MKEIQDMLRQKTTETSRNVHLFTSSFLKKKNVINIGIIFNTKYYIFDNNGY